VFIKAVSTVGRDEPPPRRGGSSRAWIWVAILIGVIVLGAVIFFVSMVGR
jgi:hypothetical protein